MMLELSARDGGAARCAGCDGQSGCASDVFSSLFGTRSTQWRVPRSTGCQVGSRVQVEIPSKSLLALAFVAYMVPVLCLLLFAVCGYYWSGNQPFWVSLSGLTGLVGGVIAYPMLSGLVFTHLDCAVQVTGQLDIALNPLIPHNQLSR